MTTPLIPVEQLRQYADADEIETQRLARILDLVEFHRSNGTRLDTTGRPILRASEQRKADRRVAAVRAVSGLAPLAPAIPTLSPNEALLRLASI